MKSKSKLVLFLLPFRRVIVSIWSVFPRSFSSLCLGLFRNCNFKLGFIIRYLCVNKLCKACGEKVIIFPGVFLKNINNLEIGTNISIHEMSYIDAYGSIKIGDNVAISHGVSILSFDHDLSDSTCCLKDAMAICKKIEIGSDVWIGAGVRILKGVEIGTHSVIASGAVLTRNVPKNTMFGGVPAVKIKNI